MLKRTLTLPILSLALLGDALAQTAIDQKDSASISGRVTIEGKPAANVVVAVLPGGWSRQMKLIAKSTTDQNGLYRLTNIIAGHYRVLPMSSAFVFSEPGSNPGLPGKQINVDKKEEIHDIDFKLSRGAVITGRIVAADGRPVVEQSVRLLSANAQDRRGDENLLEQFSFFTDDRGIYRMFGLPAGRYLVFAGESKDDRITRGGDIGAFYARTYYPSATEESQAKLVEIAAGGEATGIDINLGRLTRSYEASGRVVDENGQPVANAHYGHGALSPDGKSFDGGYGFDSGTTDANGEFHAKGFTPGSWGIWATTSDLRAGRQDTTYSDVATFEITDSNVSGLEIKMHAGASISGILTIEGTADPAVLAKRSSLRIICYPSTSGLMAPNFVPVDVNSDGSFQLTGLGPGKTLLRLGWNGHKGFSLLRVERDGVDQTGGIEVGAGEQITNVRVLVAYGTGVVRGQVEFEGGSRPPGSRFYATSSRQGSGDKTVGWAQVDTLSRFTIENLSAGDYEITVYAYARDSGTETKPKPLLKKAVTVTEGSETRVTLSLDASILSQGNQ
jgi:hypothetical protein